MKIEIDVDIPEGYEATGEFVRYWPTGVTELTQLCGYVEIRKKKREVICFEKVDEFVEYGGSFIPSGWGSEKGNTRSTIALEAKGADALRPIQWYRREVEWREEEKPMCTNTHGLSLESKETTSA